MTAKKRPDFAATLAAGNPNRARAGERTGGDVEDTVTLSFRIPINLRTRVKVLAAIQRISTQELGRRAVEDYLKIHEKQP